MKIRNISISRTPVLSITELNREASVDKDLRGESNLRELISRDDLNEEGFKLLDTVYVNQNNPKWRLCYNGDVENREIVEELGRFAQKYPRFRMSAILSEQMDADDRGINWSKQTLEINVKNGKVEVIIL